MREMNHRDSEASRWRVLAVVSGAELFGHERGNIEVLKALCSAGARVVVCVDSTEPNDVGREVHALGFESVSVPFGSQWSKSAFREDPLALWRNVVALGACNVSMRRAIGLLKPTHIHVGNYLAFSYIACAVTASRVPSWRMPCGAE